MMVKEIVLTRGQVTLVDDEDYPYLSQFNWHAYPKVTPAGTKYYARRNAVYEDHRGYTTISMAKELLGLYENKTELDPDHKDGNSLNNQRSNLRPVSKMQNNWNRRAKVGGSSKYKGVYRYKDKWKVAIMKSGTRYGLGYFEDEEQAARAYDEAALRLFGEFARTNFEGKGNS